MKQPIEKHERTMKKTMNKAWKIKENQWKIHEKRTKTMKHHGKTMKKRGVSACCTACESSSVQGSWSGDIGG